MSKNPLYQCPVCRGSGKVSAHIAEAKIDIRDRAKYNETMRKYSARARAKKKTKEALAST